MREKIKNLKKGAERIKQAILNKERIIIYADSDIDGVTSSLILEETMKNLDGSAHLIFFPNREEEGYGLNETSLHLISSSAPALLVILDCGISNFQEIKTAKQLGFNVIIVDHHEILDQLPQADIIINPKQDNNKESFRFYSTAGIVLKLAEKMLGKTMTKSLKNNFYELVAISTLADMMPETGENKIFVKNGLQSLSDGSWRPAFRVMKDFFEKNSNSQRMFAYKIISLLNTSETVNHLNESFLFLKETDKEKIEQMIKTFQERSLNKQMLIKEIMQKIERQVIKKIKNPIIFEGDKDWPLTLTGIIASRLCTKFEKPTFIYKIKDDESVGSMRTPQNINGIELIKKSAYLLKTFGGHAQAGGFRIKNENLEKFKNELIKNLENLSA